METNPRGSNHVGHETRDANPRALAYSGLVLLIVLVLVVVSMRWLFFYLGRTQSLGAPTTPYENARVLPPEPRLQPAPAQDLKTYLAEQRHILDSYGWVDKQGGIVRIPVSRAMELVLQRGLPVRKEAPQVDTAVVPTLSGGPDLGADPPKPPTEMASGKAGNVRGK